MGPCKLKWTSEEEAAMRAGIIKHGAGKWRNILKDPQFRSVLRARSNVDLKDYQDKWRNMQFTMNGQSRNRCNPGPKNIKKTSRLCDKSVALTSEGCDEDKIAQPEPPSSSNEASQEGGSKKLTRFLSENIKTVPVDGKLFEVQQGMEYDSAYSNSLWAEVDAELMRIGQMSPADAAAAAVAAVKKAEAAIAEAEEAEKEAVEAERAAEEAKAYAEELKKELRERKARCGYAAPKRGKHGPWSR